MTVHSGVCGLERTKKKRKRDPKNLHPDDIHPLSAPHPNPEHRRPHYLRLLNDCAKLSFFEVCRRYMVMPNTGALWLHNAIEECLDRKDVIREDDRGRVLSFEPRQEGTPGFSEHYIR